MLKQETRDAIRKLSADDKQALVAFMGDIMSAVDFAHAFRDADGDWTGDGENIADAFEAEIPEAEDAPDFDAEADRLHDAICEGRRQDAIDILNAVTGGQYRSVREQRNLFPDRVPA